MTEIVDLEALAALGIPTHLDVGDRMKTYEGATESRLDPTRCILARMDGRGFARLTRGLAKPELAFNAAMIQATKWIVQQTHATVGYTQSDEISIVFEPHSTESTVLFDGRVQKMTSVLAGMATVAFNRALYEREELHHLIDRMPLFDCRVYQTPTVGEAVNALLWRVRDATKNATSMVAQQHFSPKQLHGVSSADRREKLADIGVTFDTDFPDHFRNGSFWTRRVVERRLTDAEYENIPVNHRPEREEPVFRSEVLRVPMPERITFDNIAAIFTQDRK